MRRLDLETGAWGRRGGKESVDELCKLLNSDSDMDVRLAAARALGQTKEKIAMPQLADALSDSDPAMQHRLVQSLKNVSGKDFGGDVEAWRQYAKGEPVQEKPVSVAERFRKLF